MRTLPRLFALVAVSYAVLDVVGCGGGDDASSSSNPSDGGSDSSSGSTDASTDGASDAGSIVDGSADAAPAPFVSLIGRSTSIPAGPVEGYFCTTVITTAPMDITAFQVDATSGIVEATLSGGYSGPAGDFACTPGSVGGQLLYAFAAGTNELDFPAGSALHVEPQALVLNLHIDNETASTAMDTANIKIRTMGTTPNQLVQAFLVGTRSNINIPSDGVTHTATGGCSSFPASLKVFATTPMMYKSATKSTLTSVHSATTTTLIDGPFNFANQATHVLSPAVSVTAGDNVELVCSYINNTGSPLGFGDTVSNSEHCYAATYGYGIGALGVGIYQCAN